MKKLLHLPVFIMLMLCGFVATAQTAQTTVIVPNPGNGGFSNFGHWGSSVIFNDTLHINFYTASAEGSVRAKYNEIVDTLTKVPNPGSSASGYGGAPIVYASSLYGIYGNTSNKNILVKYNAGGTTVFTNPDAGEGFQIAPKPIEYQGSLYFVYKTSTNKRVLAKFNGTTISLIANPNSNPGISSLVMPYLFNNKLYYTYYDGNINQLAQFDGTTLTLFSNPEAGPGVNSNIDFVEYNSALYFAYQNVSNHGQLGKFNGITVSIIPNLATDDGGIGGFPAVYNSTLCFPYSRQSNGSSRIVLAVYDGTNISLKTNPDGGSGFNEDRLATFNGVLYSGYFSETSAIKLVKYDGNDVSLVDDPNYSNYQFIRFGPFFSDKLSLVGAFNLPNNSNYNLAFFDGATFKKIENAITSDKGPWDEFIIYKGKLFFRNLAGKPFGFGPDVFNLAYINAPLSIASSQYNVSVYGGNDGWAKVTPPPCGAGSNTFLWTPGNQTTDSIGGLTAGNYSVRIICGTDTVNQAFTITQPAFVCPTAARLYVNSAVATSGNGSTWTTAYKTFAEALLIAKNCTAVKEIWVAKGTYFPQRDPLFGFPANDRNKTFFLKDSLKVYGGFAGTETSLAQRNISANETILSGDFNNDDVVTGTGSTLSITGNTENAYHVVTTLGVSGYGVTVDGFTIKGGNADSSGVFETAPSTFIGMQNGGGAYIYGGNNTLSNNKFINNSSISFGAGFICSQDQAFKTNYINNNLVKNNKAYKVVDAGISDVGGAAVYCDTVYITNNTFDGNYALNRYGGFVFQGEKIFFSKNIITGNYAANGYAGGAGINILGTDTSIVLKNFFENNVAPADDGGALRLQGGNFTLTNNVFNKNTANRGGALFARTADLINNTFYKNTATGDLGGGYFILSATRGRPTGTGRLYNNIFYKNSADGDENSFGADIAVIDSTTTFGIIAKNNMMQSDSASYAAKFGSPSSLNMYQQNPLFADSTSAAGADNIFGTGDDGLITTALSPAINSGLNSLFTSTDSTDIRNVQRFQDTTIDRGAYETTARPTAASPQTVCSSGTVADLSATGTNIKWYSNITGGAALPTNTPLVSGNYYASQSLAGLESPRIAVAVNLQVTALPVADTVQRFCGTVTVDDLMASGTTIKWYRAVAGSTPQTYTLQNDTVTVNATDTLYVTQTLSGCESTKKQVFVFSRLTPGMKAVSDTLLCNNVPSSGFLFSSNQTVTSYSWTGSTTAIGLPISGTGNIASFTTQNNTTTPISDTIMVTPIYAIGSLSCSGTAKQFIITVNPTATVSAITNKTICNNGMVAAINFSSPATGGTIVYNWTNNNTAIGLVANGTGNIASFNATNSTTAPITATITVTPSYTNAGITCTGTARTFTITVNPAATVNTISNQVVCNSTATTAVTFGSPTTGGTIVYNWTNSTTTIGLGASGTGNLATFTATNTTTAPISATITVIPSYTNGGTTCTGTSRTFTITVNPTATVNTVSNKAECNGSVTSAISFSSPTTGGTIVYNWINNNTSIGLGASGTGTVPSFTATNTGTSGSVATITVTPSYTRNGVTCTGISTSFTITVNPPPIFNSTLNQAACNTSGTSAVVFSTPLTGGTASYNWTNSNTAIGLAANGTGNLPSFTATNTTNAPISGIISVVMTYNNAGLSCVSLPQIFIYTVNPTATVNAISNQILCNRAATTTINFSSPITGGNMVYNWTNNNTSIGLAGSGTGNITPFIAINLTATTITATITVTPVFTNAGFSCTGIAKTFTITVNPTPVTNYAINNAAQCFKNNQFVLTNSTTGANNYVWSLGDGSTSAIPDITKSFAIPGSYNVKLASSNVYGCKDSITKTITVYPQPSKPVVVPEFGNGIYSSVIASSYLWFNNNTDLANSSTQYFYPVAAGYYQVQVSTINGCADKSDSLYYIPEKNFAAGIDGQFVYVYPVPVTNGTINIHFNLPLQHKVLCRLFTDIGQLLQTIEIPAGTRQYKMDVKKLPKANYTLRFDDYYKLVKGMVVPVIN